MANLRNLKKEIKNYHNQLIDLNAKYRIVLQDGIRAILKKYGNSISFRDNEDFWEKYEYTVGGTTITYDGGNHPEYASNAFSEVYGVSLKKNYIFIECEESSEYDIERVWSIDEVESIYYALEYYDNFMKEIKKAE